MRIVTAVILTTLCSLVKGHIMMSAPPSRKSKYSEYYVSNNLVDYNIMAPLNIPGYSFPCKGFPKGPSTIDIYTNTISVTLEGSAIHGGGHCQFGISYDDNTFIVLKSVIRSCLITGMSYDVQLPNNIPSGDVTFFWTWVNAVGNREYYMECADVNIINDQNYSKGPIVGDKLVVLNLPGFPIIPEFPSPGMYDGREFILNTPKYSITPPQVKEKVKGQVQQEVHQKVKEQEVQQVILECNTDSNGFMLCDGDSYNVCSNGQWFAMNCAPGTSCKQSGSSIICDWK